MAFEKIEKDFVLSDSSINKYGMRLMTSGYDIDEFLKNPIGYYMHRYEDGVLLRWEDVAVSGDQVTGKPVINMEHGRAQRTIAEINEGFLNAASFGKLCILDYHLEDNETDPENPVIVVTRWYNKECSLVDNPGNRNAMKVELQLCDGDDNELNLKDLIFNKYKMKKITLELTPQLMGLLNLSDEKATAEAVVQGINNLHGENGRLSAAKDAAEQNLKAERNHAAGERIKTMLDAGLSDGRYNKATRDRLEQQFAGRPQELAELISDMPRYESLTDRLVDGEFPLALADKTFDELHKDGRLATVREKFPARYKQLYKEKFGVEPK
jgi:hypothetical protein